MSAKKAASERAASSRSNAEASMKKGKTKKATLVKPTMDVGKKSDKLSAFEAAVRVLGEEGRAMNCKALIETMAAWLAGLCHCR